MRGGSDDIQNGRLCQDLRVRKKTSPIGAMSIAVEKRKKLLWWRSVGKEGESQGGRGGEGEDVRRGEEVSEGHRFRNFRFVVDYVGIDGGTDKS